jgi:hypothetical protein
MNDNKMRLKFRYELKLIGDKIDVSIMNMDGTEQPFFQPLMLVLRRTVN